MATKKQKRLAGEKKQAANREANRLLGLQAQIRDRKRREAKQRADDLVEARRASVQEAVAKMAPRLPAN